MGLPHQILSLPVSLSWSWRRQWHPTLVLLPGTSQGRRSLVGCSPWGLEESDTTERLHFHFSLSCFGEGNGNALQCSCLENPRVGGAWWAAVYGVAQSWTRLINFTLTFHFHALEKEMATHSSVLAWRIPGTREPGGLPSMGSHRVGHDWSDLTAAAAQLKHYQSQWKHLSLSGRRDQRHQATDPGLLSLWRCDFWGGYPCPTHACLGLYHYLSWRCCSAGTQRWRECDSPSLPLFTAVDRGLLTHLL